MAGGGENDINLVPYMDILLNLIMFMVFVTQSVGSLHQIPVVVPEQSGGGGGGGGSDEAPKVSVIADVRDGKVTAYLSNAPSQGIEFPLAQRDAIGAQLRTWAALPNIERKVDFVASPTTPMADVIAFMDIVQDQNFALPGEKPEAGSAGGPFPNVVFTTAQ